MSVYFDEDGHRYFDEELNEYCSVSEVLRSMFGDRYSHVPTNILERAQERGILIHEEIENYAKTGDVGIFSTTHSFVKYLKDNGLEITSSEVIVSSPSFKIAGRYDLLLKKDDNSFIADIKTGKKIDVELVCWQMSIYAYLLGQKIDNGLIFHFVGDDLKVESVELLDNIEVELLFNDFSKEISWKEEHLECSKLATINDSVRRYIIEQEQAALTYTAKKAELRGRIMEEMKAKGIKKYDDGDLCITYVEPYTTERLNSKKVKELNEELYLECLNVSQVKESLKITLRGL